MSRVVCVMLAGGKGKRMGTKVSKQYLLLDEKPVLFYSLKAFEEFVDEIIVVNSLHSANAPAGIVESFEISTLTNLLALLNAF